MSPHDFLFAADLAGYGALKVVFNRVTGMKDSWIK